MEQVSRSWLGDIMGMENPCIILVVVVVCLVGSWECKSGARERAGATCE